jgi:hypothetical protein
MGGQTVEGSFPSRGHGPSAFGGTGAQFSPHVEEVQYDFSKLDIEEKRANDAGLQRSKSERRVSFNTIKGAPRHYEYYSFTKGNDWRVADRIKISAPKEELEKTVSRGKKTSSVLETMKKMSPDRRAQIDRLLDQKNLAEESRDAQWHCVFIDSPNPKIKETNGKRILEHKKMDVIVAQHILPGRAKSSSQERSKSFAGERSDINEPLKPKEKARDKDKPFKGNKEHKDGQREDPFDSDRLFNEQGVPLDRQGPIPEYPSRQLPLDQGMGQPFGPPVGQPAGSFKPNGPAHGPILGNPFSQPGPGLQLPHGIEILGDPIPPQHGANEVFHLDELLPPGKGNMHPQDHHAQFQQPHINDFNGPSAPRKKQPNQPFILQDPPKGRRHYTQKWVSDDSSRESDDEFAFFDEDERSSHTSYGDDHEKLVPRGSLVRPHRRSSVKRRDPTYREHHRGSSYPVEPSPRRIEAPRRESRYHSDRDRDRDRDHIETIIERRPRRHSSRERRETLKYVQPRRLEYGGPRSPPLTPISNSSYSPSRRFSGLPYPHEVERDRESERVAEDYMREQHIREREEEVRRRERELEDRDFFDRSRGLERERLVARGGGHDRDRDRRYWGSR